METHQITSESTIKDAPMAIEFFSNFIAALGKQGVTKIPLDAATHVLILDKAQKYDGESLHLVSVQNKTCVMLTRGMRGVVTRSAVGELVASASPLTEAQLTPIVETQMERDVLRWLAVGKRGMSSEALCFHTALDAQENHLLKNNEDRHSHPYDPADFKRRYDFFEAVPLAKANLSRMKQVSPTWNLLVDAWSELSSIYESEPHATHPTKLYERMREIRDAGQVAEQQVSRTRKSSPSP
jgi:hypothetical protein